MSKHVNPVEKYLIRYHIVILVVIGSIALGASIFSSYLTYSQATTPQEQGEMASDIPTTFDEATIERIEALHSSDTQNIDTSIPEGRINPFAE